MPLLTDQQQHVRHCNRDGREPGVSDVWISLNGFLNYLDGILSPNETVFFLTSNHPEKLDAAVMRPGWVDVHLRVEPPTEPTLVEDFSRFYLNAWNTLPVQDSDEVAVGNGMSTAEITGCLQLYAGGQACGSPKSFAECADVLLSQRTPVE